MIFILFGKSGVGKSTVYKDLIKYKKYDLTPIVPYTTRPPRPDDIEGIDYHFINKDQFLEMMVDGDLFEATKFKVANGDTWYYGTPKADYKSKGDKIIIANPFNLKSILKNCRHNKIPAKAIYLYCQSKVSFRRLVDRDDDMKEASRRIDADKKDFTRKLIECAHYKVDTSNVTPKEAGMAVGDIILSEKR